MYTIMPQSEGKVVGIKATGRIDSEDFQNIMPQLIAVFQKNSPIRLLMDWTNFDGFTSDAESDEFQFLINRSREIELAAIVGPSKWMGRVNQIEKMTSIEMRLFDTNEMSEAWQWLKSK